MRPTYQHFVSSPFFSVACTSLPAPHAPSPLPLCDLHRHARLTSVCYVVSCSSGSEPNTRSKWDITSCPARPLRPKYIIQLVCFSFLKAFGPQTFKSQKALTSQNPKTSLRETSSFWSTRGFFFFLAFARFES